MKKQEIRSFGIVFNGKTPSKTEQRKSGYPILKIRDIDEAGQFRGVFESFVDPVFYEKHSKKILNAGDTIILNAAHNADYVGSKNAFVPAELHGVIATGEWLVVRVKEANPQYVNQYLKSPVGRKSLKNCVKGIHLYPKDVERISVPLLPLDDQKRIVHLLGKLDHLIAQRKQHLQQLDDLLKSVFLQMFGDPVSNEKGWIKKPLNQIGTLDRGVSKHRPRNAPELLGGKYPLIQTGDVSNAGVYITKFKQTYSDIGFNQSRLWPAGTLCITIAANIAQTGVLTFDACFPDSVVGFTANESDSDPLYVLGLFWFFQRILEKNAPAAAQKNINLKILRELEVPTPPIEVQGKFAAFVEKTEKVKDKYQQSLTDLEGLYSALSQQAFKGKLDLSRVSFPENKKTSIDLGQIPAASNRTLKASKRAIDQLNDFNSKHSAILKALQAPSALAALDIPALKAAREMAEQVSLWRTPLDELKNMDSIARATEALASSSGVQKLAQDMASINESTKLAKQIADSLPKLDMVWLKEQQAMIEAATQPFMEMRKSMAALALPDDAMRTLKDSDQTIRSLQAALPNTRFSEPASLMSGEDEDEPRYIFTRHDILQALAEEPSLSVKNLMEKLTKLEVITQQGYERIKRLVFELLNEGEIEQHYNDEDNNIALKALA